MKLRRFFKTFKWTVDFFFRDRDMKICDMCFILHRNKITYLSPTTFSTKYGKESASRPYLVLKWHYICIFKFCYYESLNTLHFLMCSSRFVEMTTYSVYLKSKANKIYRNPLLNESNRTQTSCFILQLYRFQVVKIIY